MSKVIEKKIKNFCFILIFFMCFTAKVAYGIVNFSVPESVKQGEPFIVKIFTNETLEDITLHWLNKSTVLLNTPVHGKITAILASNALQRPGKQTVTLRFRIGAENYELQKSVNIISKNYPKEALRVNPNKVNFSSDIKKRLEKEKKIYGDVTASSYKGGNFILPFARPCKGQFSSRYGNVRIFNNKPFGFHGGTDFRASMGTPIKSVADGRVCLTSHFYLSGGIIMIDHGAGLFSSYCHMSKKFVKVGDIVKRGQVIGLSGASGRVTGPHLHLEMCWNGIRFNATSLLEK
ncbi:MAG: M23 family metallopeptidase [Synergistaceae bacterium]|nr:M23 family metallopeptidase [Synergistaceae bacterium]